MSLDYRRVTKSLCWKFQRAHVLRNSKNINLLTLYNFKFPFNCKIAHKKIWRNYCKFRCLFIYYRNFHINNRLIEIFSTVSLFFVRFQYIARGRNCLINWFCRGNVSAYLLDPTDHSRWIRNKVNFGARRARRNPIKDCGVHLVRKWV